MVGLCAKAAAAKHRWVVVPKASYSIRLTIYRAQLRGDWDNFAKALTDPLKGVIWYDDSQVKSAHVSVELDRENPRAHIAVFREVIE